MNVYVKNVKLWNFDSLREKRGNRIGARSRTDFTCTCIVSFIKKKNNCNNYSKILRFEIGGWQVRFSQQIFTLECAERG